MGAFPAAIFTTRAETKERKKQRAFEAEQIRAEREDETRKKKEAAAIGRAALIQTTPQGVLNPQTSGRKRLTA